MFNVRYKRQVSQFTWNNQHEPWAWHAPPLPRLHRAACTVCLKCSPLSLRDTLLSPLPPIHSRNKGSLSWTSWGGVKSGGGGGQGLKEIQESKQFTSKHLLKAHPPLCPPFQSWIARTPPPSDLVPFAAQSPSPAMRFGTWTTYDKITSPLGGVLGPQGACCIYVLVR